MLNPLFAASVVPVAWANYYKSALDQGYTEEQAELYAQQEAAQLEKQKQIEEGGKDPKAPSSADV
jgi:hypothetical protein